MLSPFSPFATILGLSIDDVPVVEDNLQYYETDSDFWLCYDVAALRSCVATSDGARVSEWRFNPGYAVSDLQQLIQSAN